MLEYQVGEFEQGAVYLERLMDVVGAPVPGATAPVMIAWIIAEVARITGASDRFDFAEAAAEAVLLSPSITPEFSASARVGLALIAVQRADAAAASEQYAALQILQDFLVKRSDMSAERLLGLLSQTMGKLGQAMSHFEEALTFCRKGGYRPELAWTCCDYADTLRDRDGDGDRARAISLLDESLSISSELRMRPLMERVLSRREILKA